MTTLPELLEKARQLATEGWAEGCEVESLAVSIGRTQAAFALQQSLVKDYSGDEARARGAMTGRAKALETWNAFEALLNEAEESELEAMTNLQALKAELRRKVALAEHEKAKAAREEVRA